MEANWNFFFSALAFFLPLVMIAAFPALVGLIMDKLKPGWKDSSFQKHLIPDRNVIRMGLIYSGLILFATFPILGTLLWSIFALALIALGTWQISKDWKVKIILD